MWACLRGATRIALDMGFSGVTPTLWGVSGGRVFVFELSRFRDLEMMAFVVGSEDHAKEKLGSGRELVLLRGSEFGECLAEFGDVRCEFNGLGYREL